MVRCRRFRKKLYSEKEYLHGSFNVKVNTACRSIGLVKSYGGKVKKLQTDFLKIMEVYDAADCVGR